MEFEKDASFEIELFDATHGAMIGRANRTAVTITNDDGKYCFKKKSKIWYFVQN